MSVLDALNEKRFCKYNRDYDIKISKNIDRFNSGDDIKEARGSGISIVVFGDVANKIVLTPEHLNHLDTFIRYNYCLGYGTWGQIEYNIGDVDLVNNEMYNIGKAISEYEDVWIVWPDVDGKGRNSSEAILIDDDNDDEITSKLRRSCPIILFVFTKMEINELIALFE